MVVSGMSVRMATEEQILQDGFPVVDPGIEVTEAGVVVVVVVIDFGNSILVLRQGSSTRSPLCETSP